MLKPDQLTEEAIALPIELRTKLINRLLTSINPEHKDIDALWKKEVEHRVKDITGKKVKCISGESIFREINKRFNK